MKKEQFLTKGFSLVEVLLACSFFAIIVMVLTNVFIYSLETASLYGNRERAVFLAEEGLEAVRNIRDGSFSNLSPGTFGISVSGSQWIFSGSSDSNGIFNRSITISSIDAKRMHVSSNVLWQQNLQRTGNISLSTYLSNWQIIVPVDCNSYCQSLMYSAGTCRNNKKDCTNNGENYEIGGDVFCSKIPPKRCCCAP